MENITYSEKLKDPRWERKRLEILRRDDCECRFCGAPDGTHLHVHHLYYIYDKDPWDYEDDALISLCRRCHHENKHERNATLDSLGVPRGTMCMQDYEYFKNKDLTLDPKDYEEYIIALAKRLAL